MRLLNLNFLSCAVKTCKVSNKSFPLHPKDAELAQDDEVVYKPEILVSLLPRLDWDALRTTCTEVSIASKRSSARPDYIPRPRFHRNDACVMEASSAGLEFWN